MPGRHRESPGRHRRPALRRSAIGRVALAAALAATAPAVVLASSAPPAPSTVEQREPPFEVVVPPATPTGPPAVEPPAPPPAAVGCETIADVDAAQAALDGDLGLAPVLDTDGDGLACEARWPRTPLDAAGDAVQDVVDDVADTLTGQCSDSGFDGVASHVAEVGHHLEARFALGQILGVGTRVGRPTSDHPRGLALDLFAGRVVGDQLAAYVLDRRTEFGVTYVIWRQRINYGSGWEPMADRGGITANHFDHVHVSFEAGADVAALPC